jgi:hypothetical protein
MSDKPKVRSTSNLEVKVIIELTEAEARALYNIVGYGPKPFLTWFYTHLGVSYLKPHEAGLISLFDTVRGEIPRHLSMADEARQRLRSDSTIVANNLPPRQPLWQRTLKLIGLK